MREKDRNKKWIMFPQECEGTYRFDGYPIYTLFVKEFFPFDEILVIINEIKSYVKKHNGADYLFVYKNMQTQKKIFIIDNLNDEMKKNADKQYVKDNNYFTIMLAEEY